MTTQLLVTLNDCCGHHLAAIKYYSTADFFFNKITKYAHAIILFSKSSSLVILWGKNTKPEHL